MRGVALLGLFFTGAIAFGQPHAAFFNLEVPGDNSVLDWTVAFLGELFFDQKMLALLALIYGSSLMRFCDRLAEQGIQARGPGLRRALVLFALGVPVGMHGLIWEGLPLWFFGFCTPALLILRKRGSWALAIVGGAGVLLAALAAIEFQGGYDEFGSDLGQYWISGAHGSGDDSGAYVFFSTFFLLVGTLTLGLLLERRGLMAPRGDRAKSMAVFGLAFGLSLALTSVVWRHLGDYSADVSMIGETPNTLAAVPMALGYVGVINLWSSARAGQALQNALARVGQMALTTSILLTVFGIFVLRDGLFERAHFSRIQLAGVVLLLWIVLLFAANIWLDRFRYGPAEWLVRSVTYRRRLTMRR